MLGQFESILKFSNSEAVVQVENTEGAAGEEDKFEDHVVVLVARERDTKFGNFIGELERSKAVSE